jgi:hypothetical protein
MFAEGVGRGAKLQKNAAESVKGQFFRRRNKVFTDFHIVFPFSGYSFKIDLVKIGILTDGEN